MQTIAKYLRVRDVARMLCVSEDSVRRWISEGKLEAVRFGDRGHWLVPEHALGDAVRLRQAVATAGYIRAVPAGPQVLGRAAP